MEVNQLTMLNLQILDRLATDIVDFAVIPFIGAGCSLGLTAGADWKAATEVLAHALGLGASEWTSETAVAQGYEERFGRDALVAALRERLTISDFDDELGSTHLALMCLNFPAIYTTNVENAIELCHAKYGRSISVVSSLSDLRSVIPGRSILYKYHGDLQQPESLVWTERDYARRKANQDFFLNVRLRSDLLTKTLLFVGYSVRDPHVVELLATAQSLYAAGFRGGVIIAAGDATALATRLQEENLTFTIVDPRMLFPEETDIGSAIDRTLQEVLNRVTTLRSARELQSLFTSRTPEPQRLLSPKDLSSLETVIPGSSLSEAVRAFRQACDGCLLPHDIQQRVIAIVCTLIERGRNEHNAKPLEQLLFNLHLQPMHALTVANHAYTLYSVSGNRILHIPTLDERHHMKLLYFAGAYAILRDSGELIPPRFAGAIAQQGFGSEDLTPFSEEGRMMITSVFNEIFKDSPLTNPISRPYPGVRVHQMTFAEMRSIMTNSLSAEIQVPFEG